MRLERSLNWGLLNEFQFHYGAIMRSFFRLISNPNIPISIPLWCDYEVEIMRRYRSLLNISIPLWCDYEVRNEPAIRLISFISIPLWCDYEYRHFLYLKPPLLFQFHYGAIMRLCLLPDSCCYQTFQFHYGAIMSPYCFLFFRSYFLISIPLWCDYESIVRIRHEFIIQISIPLWCDYE